MNLEQYIAEREAQDPEFAAAREALRPQQEFRRALIKARLDRGLTQRAMAEKLGVKQSALAPWEAGETLPTLTTLFRLAQVLDLRFSVTPERPLVLVSHREDGGGPQTLDRLAATCSLSRRMCVHAALRSPVKYASSGVQPARALWPRLVL